MFYHNEDLYPETLPLSRSAGFAQKHLGQDIWTLSRDCGMPASWEIDHQPSTNTEPRPDIRRDSFNTLVKGRPEERQGHCRPHLPNPNPDSPSAPFKVLTL